MQPRVLLTAFLLAAGLLVAVMLFLGDAPHAGKPRPPVAVPVAESELPAGELPQMNPVDLSTTDQEPSPPSIGGGVITGVVQPLEGLTIPADLSVRLLRMAWPKRFANKVSIPATDIVYTKPLSGIQDDLPLISELKDIFQEVARIPCPEDGEFTFDGLGAGSYLVCAGGRTSIWSPANQRIVLGEKTSWEGHCDVPLQPTLSQSIQVVASGIAVEDAWVGLRGEIVDRALLPQSLFLPVQKVWLFLLNDPFVSAISSESGRVEFPVLPEIPYLIHARKPGVGIGTGYANLREETIHTIDLKPGGSVTGVVSDSNGVFLEGAEVKLAFAVNINVDYFIPGAESTSAEDGSFQFDDLMPGRYSLEVELPGYQTRKISSLAISPGQALHEEITLELGHEISGRVLNIDGEPLKGQTVRLRPDTALSVVTDDEGLFHFDTLANRRYRVSVSGGCTIHSSIQVEVDGDPLEIVVEPGSAIVGRFVDGEGLPVSGVEVQIADSARSEPDWRYSTDVSGEDGRFSICSEITADPDEPLYLLGYPLQYEKLVIDLQEGASDLGEIVLTPASWVHGTTRAADGSVLGGVQLTLTSSYDYDEDPTGVMTKTAGSGAWGEYSIHLPASSRAWELKASHAEFPESDTVSIPAGEPGRDIPIDVTLFPGATLDVRVTSAGLPIADAYVEVKENKSWTLVSKVAVTDHQGSAIFKGLSTNPHTVMVRKHGLGTGKAEVDLVSGQDFVEEVALDAAISFAGQVVCEGVPVSGAEINVTDVSGRRISTVTGLDGRFVADQLASGALTIGVLAEGFLQRRVSGVDPRESPLTITLERSHSLVGFLFDRNTREPVTGALIKTTPVTASGQNKRGARRVRSVRSDDEGFFERPNLPAGYYKVEILSSAHLPKTEVFRLPAHQEVIEIPLQRGEQIRVQVVDQQGVPIPKVRVRPMFQTERSENRWRWSFVPMHRRLQTDDRGELTIGGLEEGPYRLRVDHRDYLVTDRAIEVGFISRSEVQRFTLTRGATISGTVYRADGELASREALICECIAGGGKGNRTEHDTSSKGEFRIRQLPAGEYLVRPKSGGGTQVTVVLQPGQTVALELETGP